MNELFVTHEQALALKELGYNEHPLCSYHIKSGEIIFTNDGPNRNSDLELCPIENNISCSTILRQQAFKFFREKYNKNSFIELVYDNGLKYDYCLYVNKSPEECINFMDGPYKTYEEAENACIDKIIEDLKKELNERNN